MPCNTSTNEVSAHCLMPTSVMLSEVTCTTRFFAMHACLSTGSCNLGISCCLSVAIWEPHARLRCLVLPDTAQQQLVAPFGHAHSGCNVTLIISRFVTVNSDADGSIKVAMTAFREWLCITAPAPLSSYACRKQLRNVGHVQNLRKRCQSRQQYAPP